jgi:hypothetical protein
MNSTSRNLLLALLVVAIAVAVIYMMDPTFFGLFKRTDGFHANVTNTQPAQSVSGQAAGTNAAEGDAIRKAIEAAMKQNAAAAGGAPKKAVEGFANPTKKERYEDMGAAPMPAPEMPAPPMPPMQPTATATATATPMGVASAPSGMEGFADYNAGPSVAEGLNGVGPANCYPKNQLSPQELLPMDQNSTWAQANPAAQGSIAGKNFLSAGSLIGVNTVGQSLRNANQQLRAEPPCPQMKVSIWNESTIEPDLIRRPLE